MFFFLQLLSNVAIYLCAITVGTMSYYMADRKHRKAFLEARQSLEVKLNLEEQSQQQVGGHIWGQPGGIWDGGNGEGRTQVGIMSLVLRLGFVWGLAVWPCSRRTSWILVEVSP